VTDVGDRARGARRTAVNVLFSAGSQIAGKALTLVWTLVAARLLDAGDFGIFFYVLAVSALITAMSEWGFDNVLVREASRAPERLGRLTGAALRLEVGVAVPALVVSGIAIALSQHGAEYRWAVVLVFAAAPLEVFSDTCRAASQAAQAQGGTATALVVQRLATAVLIVLALVVGFDLVGLCGGFLLGAVVGAVAHFVALRRLQLDISLGWRSEVAGLVSASWFVGASAVALIALSRLDTVILQLLKGSREVGLYAATYRLLDTTLFFTFALSSGIFPAMSAAGEPRQAGAGLRSGSSAAAFLYAPFAAACLVDAEPLLRLLFGDQFTGAAPALQWLSLAAIPYAIAYLGNGALQALDLSRWMLISAVGAVLLNVGANLALVPHYGATGAGAATALAYAAEALVVLVVLRRARDVRAGVLSACVIPVVAGAFYALALWALPLPAIVEVVVGGVGYLALALGMMRVARPDELTAIRALARSRGSVAG
jgi:O-antigen/teichoic acid export membrane protein